jgi:hypothetical protein
VHSNRFDQSNLASCDQGVSTENKTMQYYKFGECQMLLLLLLLLLLLFFLLCFFNHPATFPFPPIALAV